MFLILTTLQELLDHSLVEGYKSVFPEESGRKLQFSAEPKSPGKRFCSCSCSCSCS